jgi:hypothetical protein
MTKRAVALSVGLWLTFGAQAQGQATSLASFPRSESYVALARLRATTIEADDPTIVVHSTLVMRQRDVNSANGTYWKRGALIGTVLVGVASYALWTQACPGDSAGSPGKCKATGVAFGLSVGAIVGGISGALIGGLFDRPDG